MDTKTKTLISKNLLLSGIRYSRYGIDDFRSSEIKTFFNEYMANEMFQNATAQVKRASINNPDGTTNRTKEISQMVADILDSLPEYINNERIAKCIQEILEKYNQELDDMFRHKQSDTVKLVNISSADEVMLYNKLKADLAVIKDEAMTVSNDKREYVAMYDLMNQALIALDGNNPVNNSNAIINDIVVIKTEIISKFNNVKDISVEGELRDIILNYKKLVVAYLRDGEENEIAKLKTLDEFILMFKSKFVVYLANILKYAYNVNDIDKINSECINEMHDNFLKNGIKYIDNYLKEINEMAEIINTYGQKKEKVKMREIMRQDYTFNDGVDEVTKIVRNKFMKLYAIVLDIKERQMLERRQEEFKVSVDVVKGSR